jgi:hypothetical protein
VLRSKVVFIVLLGVCGCAAFDPEPSFSAPGPCGALASQRLQDAQLAGLAEGHDKAIFDHAYRSCLAAEKR